MRYGLHPLLRKMWSLKGHRVTAPVKRRFEWGYLFCAIEVEQGASEFFYVDGVLKEFDHQFLNQISRSHLECEHVVIGDGAGFHHREDQENQNELPSNIHILTLPPYSPELNPIEKFRDIVKDEICTYHWENLSELEAKITEVLETWWKKPKGYISLFRHSYLKSELNAI